MAICEICELLKTNPVVYKTEYWTVQLSTLDQKYLGRCFVTANRHVGSIRELTPEEWSELKHVMDTMENSLRLAFGATLFNWNCLMNNAYQEKEPSPHVHWHLRPRYDKPKDFMGIRFEDKEFGHNHNSNEPRALPPETLKEIAERIKACVSDSAKS